MDWVVEGRVWRKALSESSVSTMIVSMLAIDEAALLDGVVYGRMDVNVRLGCREGLRIC